MVISKLGVMFLFAFLLVLFQTLVSSQEPELGPFNITVTVTNKPSLSILSPKNDTYFSNSSLNLEVLSNADNLWYNLDNGENFSFSSGDSPVLNAESGAHKLHVFANNSYGVTSRDVSFFIDLGLFTVLYDEYKTAVRGSSTNFESFSFNEIQSLGSIVLENTLNGKIKFNELVNLTEDYNPNDSILDLDSNTNISFNRIEIDSDSLSNFNKDSTITFYNLFFSNPRILRNGIFCSNCQIISYANGNLSFGVSGFTGNDVYTTEETVQDVSGGSEGSGGGGPLVLSKEGFEVDRESIKAELYQGTSKIEQFEVYNPGSRDIDINISSDIAEVSFSEYYFKLAKREREKVDLNIDASDLLPNIYLGKVVIESDGVKREINLIIEVESVEVLFDLEVEILNDLLKKNKKLDVNVTLVNIAGGDPEIVLVYEIYNQNGGDKVFEESQTLRFFGKTSFIKEFDLKELNEGDYILYAKIVYGTNVASSSDEFVIHEGTGYLFLILVLVALILLALSLIFRKRIGLFKEKHHGKR